MAQDRRTSVLPKACSNCRVRKIRCDKKVPCSSCETSGILCPLLKHAGGSAVLPKQQYASTAIDKLGQDIGRIEQSLQRLLLIHEASEPSVSLPGRTTPAEASPVNISSPALYEGASSFTNQAISAGETSQMLARDLVQLSAAQDGLKALRTILQASEAITQEANQHERTKSQQQFSNAPLQLLPSEFVVELLRQFKNRPSVMFLLYGLGAVPEIEESCQKMYFPFEPMPQSSQTKLHGMLHNLIYELMFMPEAEIHKQWDIEKLRVQCERLFEAGLQKFDIYTNPTFDHAASLTLASSNAWEASEVSRSWQLISCAARQVLSLGLHREASYSTLDPEESNQRRRLFWLIYSWDKHLALRLGQTPNIHDYDIDVNVFEVSTVPGIGPWDTAAISFLKFARLEGRVYDELYSAAASKKTAHARAESTQRLAQEFQEWYEKYKPHIESDILLSELYLFIYGTADVLYYSHLTTVYRSASVPGQWTISDACYQAARHSINCHLEAIPKISALGGEGFLQSYLNWNLLYGAFTPLMVIFLHAISTSASDDVVLLQEFLASLDAVRDVPGETARLRRACSIFISVAGAYLGTGRTDDSQIPVNTRNKVTATQPADSTFSVPTELQADLGHDGAYGDETLRFIEHWIDGEQNVMDYFSKELDPVYHTG